MATEQSIEVGFEVGTGALVSIPVRHMVVTGQTQASGKTTTLEALITRSSLRAVAFVTKRGEGAFQSAREIKPYFEERADWEYVKLLLESAYRQRLKFEESWIMRACEGADALSDVLDNARKMMGEAKRSFDKDMFMKLVKYLEKVVPGVAQLPKSATPDLRAGLNVMNLSGMRAELRSLVIASTLRWIHEHESRIVSLIPEAWETVPQGRNTPVKLEVVQLVRKGAGIGNFVWIDAQDMAAVDNELLRAATVWLVGVQRERNEVKRSLENMAAGMVRPKPAEIGRLRKGEFFVCVDDQITKTYVRPAWLDKGIAHKVALGELKAENVQTVKLSLESMKRFEARKDAEEMTENGELAAAITNLANVIRSGGSSQAIDEDRIVERVLSQLDVAPLVEQAVKRLPTNGHSQTFDYEEIARRVLPLIPSGGTIKVEPKEVVLKQFQEAEVARVLAMVEGLSAWQKSVLSLIEAKGSRASKADCLRLILGRTSDRVHDYKQKYDEIEVLADEGFLRKESSWFYSNLAGMIKERLKDYNANEQDVEAVIGQVLIRLNGRA